MKYFLLISIFLFSQLSNALQARIVTDLGSITIDLLESKAPKTVENFVKLASGEQKYVDTKGLKSTKPFYNGLTFHRTHPDLGIFSGCQWGTGRGWPGYYVLDEAPEKSDFSTSSGWVAMAKMLGDNRVGSQFFITNRPEPRFNGKYTIFGKVVLGMDIVDKIANVPHDMQLRPKQPVHIQKVEIIRQ
jgi:peptidyl-prolyl cis-trans isomerase A (cyclophilin A)